MNWRRVFVLAQRIVRQILHDRRTVGLLIFVPLFILTVGALLFRAEQAAIPLGVVNEDAGLQSPLGGQVGLGTLIAAELATGDTFAIVTLSPGEVDDRLRDGTVQGAVVFPEEFSARFQENQQAVIDLRLEGSNPTRGLMIRGGVLQAAMKALARLATVMGTGEVPDPATILGGEMQLPVEVEATYLFGGHDFDTVDFIAPVYVGFLALFFVFLLTSVSFLRERSQGTMERLLATPANRLELVLGYVAGLGLFALIQATVILSFTIWVLKVHYLGSLALLFLTVALLTMVGISLGILASAFARNEFQIVQFIPMIIIPQGLLAGTFWPVEEMPVYLKPLAYAMPLTYANNALRDVMLKGMNILQTWPNLAILLGFVVLTITLGSLTMRREVA
jgi:ABC-2 type transport system permease protein